MKLYTIQGKEVWLLTINELSKVTGIKSRTLRVWEQKGILPKASVTDKIYSPLSKQFERRRLYTEQQAEVLANWVARVQPRQGVVLKQSIIDILHRDWITVTNKFLTGTLGGKNDSEGSEKEGHKEEAAEIV